MNNLRDILHFMSKYVNFAISQKIFKQKRFYCSVSKSSWHQLFDYRIKNKMFHFEKLIWFCWYDFYFGDATQGQTNGTSK